MTLSLENLLPLVGDHAAVRELVAALAADGDARPLPAFSAIDAAKPALLAALHAAAERPMLVVTARAGRARALVEELRAWSATPSRVLAFPELDGFPYER